MIFRACSLSYTFTLARCRRSDEINFCYMAAHAKFPITRDNKPARVKAFLHRVSAPFFTNHFWKNHSLCNYFVVIISFRIQQRVAIGRNESLRIRGRNRLLKSENNETFPLGQTVGPSLLLTRSIYFRRYIHSIEYISLDQTRNSFYSTKL